MESSFLAASGSERTFRRLAASWPLALPARWERSPRWAASFKAWGVVPMRWAASFSRASSWFSLGVIPVDTPFHVGWPVARPALFP